MSGTLRAGARSYATRIINLSVGGALLSFVGPLPEPTLNINDRLSLEIRCRGAGAPLRLEGRAVLWNTYGGGTPLLAVQFDEVTGEPADILEDLMLEALPMLHERKAGGARSR